MQDDMKVTKAKRRNAGKLFVKCSVNTKTQRAEKPIRIGVLGASGYTGSEVQELPEIPFGWLFKFWVAFLG